MAERKYRLTRMVGRSNPYQYACAELGNALSMQCPQAISALEEKVTKRNQEVEGKKEGLIAIAIGCPCCDGYLYEDLGRLKQFEGKDTHVLLVSPFPGIDRAGISFDFVSKQYPEFRRSEGNNEKYIQEFVEGILALLK
jgi:hypothetical protein